MKKLSIILLALTSLALALSLTSCGGCEHDWDAGVYSTEPTCTEGGTLTKTCTKCTETESTAVAPAGHTNTQISSVEPTCSAPGERVLLCSVCNATTTETIPTLDHAFTILLSESEPTCSLEGRQAYRCENCSLTKEDLTPATGVHEYHTDEEYMMEIGRAHV